MNKEITRNQTILNAIQLTGGREISQNTIKEVLREIEELELEERWEEWIKKSRRVRGLAELSNEIIKGMEIERLRNEMQWRMFRREILERCGEMKEAPKFTIEEIVKKIIKEFSIQMKEEMSLKKGKEEEEERRIAEKEERKEEKEERTRESVGIKRVRCYICNKLGHISRYCWRRNSLGSINESS